MKCGVGEIVGGVGKMDRQGKIQEGVDLLARSAFSAAESRRTPCTDLTFR